MIDTTNINASTEQIGKQKEIPSVAALDLRDYFAAKAMAAYIAQGGMYARHLADSAYAMADTMIAARDQ